MEEHANVPYIVYESAQAMHFQPKISPKFVKFMLAEGGRMWQKQHKTARKTALL